MSKVIKLGQYKDIEVNIEKHEVTKEEVDAFIAQMVANSTSLEDKEGVVENGDVTTIDFEGFKDGVAFAGGKAENYQLVIGSHSFIPGFEEQMIGMEKGETRDLNLTFPENYQAADLAGAAVVFKVTVHNIQVKKAAELNDEFVKGLNQPGMETVEDLKLAAEQNLQMQANNNFARDVENAVFDILLANSEVELDDADVEASLNQQVERIAYDVMSQGMQLDQYLQMIGMNQEVLREQLIPSAKSQVKFEAIIDEVVRVENIDTTDEEIEEYLNGMSAQYNVDRETLLKDLTSEGIKRDMNRFKSSQLIIRSAIVK